MSKLKCHNCGYEYANKDELSPILNIQEFENGEWHTIDRIIYEGRALEITESRHEEVFYGCAGCLSDDGLQEI